MRSRVMVCAAALALFVGTSYAENSIKSGPQVGKSPGAFAPLHATGADEGQKRCLVCSHGTNPVAMVFAREVTPSVATLVKKIDEATVKNADCSMGSFVVFLNDEEGFDKKLKDLAKKEGIKETVLAIDSPAGPKGYDIAKDADVTVVLYNKRNVKTNLVFKKGELKDSDVEKVVAELTKILPTK